MSKLRQLLVAGTVAVLLTGAAAGCGGAARQRVEIGARVAPEAPPSAQEVYFEHKAGQVWVHGRWARQDEQWVWQPGYHQPAQPGKVWMNGYWDRQDGRFVWVEGHWGEPRVGQVFVPGYWDTRGSAHVWIRDRWEPERPGEVWVPGAWEGDEGARAWADGHWQAQTASP